MSGSPDLTQSRDQPLNILLIIKEVRRDSNALRFLGHDHATTQQMANDAARLIDLHKRLRGSRALIL